MNIDFHNIPISEDWAFSNVRSTEQWTHGYHRYPAKFLPNVVKKLIESYAKEGDIIVDLFAGCGTTLVEAKVHGFESIGTDINPVAKLITKAKITPLNPLKLEKTFTNIKEELVNYSNETEYFNKELNQRIDYWFTKESKNKIAFLYLLIYKIKNTKDRNFFLVGLSHILKNCSRWLQTSTKPQVDPNKKIPEVFHSFISHIEAMLEKNSEFYKKLEEDGNLNTPCKILKRDARHTKLDDEIADMIITSPPYVTSYEYADIHQLTGYWMEYINDMKSFRKEFIGTSYSGNKSLKTPTVESQKIVDELCIKSKVKAKSVANYFNDMFSVSKEMYRVLRKGGYDCVVIGDTTILDVHIKSAEIFYEFLLMQGFQKVNIIRRNIPYKLMPTLRNKITGKFTTLDDNNCKKVYPDEYIIIVRK